MIQSRERLPRHAVVIGGSMAGLLAARVLSDHFDRVTIVERDVYPDGPVFRPGVPQMRQLHVLLGRGQKVLEHYYPGLGSELDSAGAQRFEWPADVLWLSPAGWSQRYRPGLSLLSCSRALLEWQVRQRTLALKGVAVRGGYVAEGLVMSPGGTAVVGVRLRHRPAPGAAAPREDETGDGTSGARETTEATELAADLVVDASGRESHLPTWLEAAGYPTPPVERINAFLGYATRLYSPPADSAIDWKLLMSSFRAPNTRAGAITHTEGGKWIVLLAGNGRDFPPTDDAGYLTFAEGMRTPLFAQALRAATPLSPVYGYRRTENQWRHYEKVARWPERLAVVGDAAVAFNPIYGQGMSVAAIEAQVLDASLREQRRRKPDGDLTGFARRFQAAQAKAAATPWLMATGEDLRYPATEGPRVGRVTRLMQRYTDRVIQVATEDPTVGLAFARVSHLLSPFTILFSPAVVVRTLLDQGMPGLEEPPTRTRFAQPVASRAEERLPAD